MQGKNVWNPAIGLGALALCGLSLLAASPARGADCMTLLPMFQRGGTDSQIAELTGLTTVQVGMCRQELSRPINAGPAGAPPMGAAGAPPMGAAGRPPMGAAGAPPMGAAGAPPMGAAGAPPMGSKVQRLP